ncbi:DNA glycosylase [Nitrosopumilus sp.]|uniref:DNA-3-methyladenine glycosylase 2 n=1 Tax=Nitrosopumilus sp. TaxID=2024843 RepID=UPI002605D471|nr:DNA glycosylase [Nitrosopumilus sp.]
MQNFNTINVENTIQSGQVFLWQKTDDFWYGVNGQNILKVDKIGKITSFKKNKSDFFRNNDNLEKIIKMISKDSTTKKAIKNYLGLRLMDQDPFQCMISFIVSSNSNIQKIKICLERLSEKFGEKVEFDKKEFFVFPKPETLAEAQIKEIMKCGTGYRSKFIKSAANMVVENKIDFKKLRKYSYSQTREEICKVPGIGNKVADCIMLFSLNKLEAFPLDRWMIRILEKYYSNFHLETKTITEKQYELLHEKIVSYYGEYAGYAQQFLFKMERENFDKKWL